MAVVQQSKQNDTAPDALAVWRSVSQWLPPHDEHADYWWNLSGPHLCALLRNAGYSAAAQYKALLFLHHHVVPTLGSAPQYGNAALESGLSLDGTRIEYSWRWPGPDSESGAGSRPEIRVVVEPIGRFAGTPLDPLNLQPATEILHNMTSRCPALDMRLFHHFLGKFFDSPAQKDLETKERPVLTNLCLGFEFLEPRNGEPMAILPKAYFLPRKLNQKGLTPMSVWQDALRTAVPGNPTLDRVLAFIQDDAPGLGLSLTPLWLGIDAVSPEAARVKLYCVESHTSFASVTKVLTMGGRLPVAPAALDAVWDLIRAASGLPGDFPRGAETPRAPRYDLAADGFDTVGLWGGFTYYFDVGETCRSDDGEPDIKFYLPTAYYGVTDEDVAKAMTAWMVKHGRGRYVEAYWDSLRRIISHRGLHEARGAQMWLSVMIRKGDIQVTCYVAPEGYHPKRHPGSQQSYIAERVVGHK